MTPSSRHNLLWLLFVVFTVFNTRAVAQNQAQSPISKNYTNITLENILKDLNQEYNTNIYWLKGLFSNELIDYNAQNATPEQVINDLISTMELRLINYRNGAYIILRNETQDDYFDELKSKVNQSNISTDTEVASIILKGESINGANEISGMVNDGLSKEEIIGAQIDVDGKPMTTTNIDGKYNIKLTKGAHNITINYLGYKSYSQGINIEGKVTFDIILEKDAKVLDEVTIVGEGADIAVRESQIGVARIDVKNLDKLPLFLGESDVVKAVLINPGVSSIGEGASGFNVRGGNVDQNLVLQDDAILFNSTHALGFFSTFNSLLIKNAKLTKGNLAASQGGRLASVLEVGMKDGNKNKVIYKASITPITATVSIDGPMSKNSQFLVGFRSTYSDYIFGLFQDEALKNTSAGFYDINAKYTHKIGDNTLTASGYFSKDRFSYNNQFGFDYKTSFVQASWQRLISDKKYFRFALVGSDYDSGQSNFQGLSPSEFRNRIKYLKFTSKYSYQSKKVNIDGGLSSVFYQVSPGSISPIGTESAAIFQKLDDERGIESAAYLHAEIKLTEWIDFIAGVRLNMYNSVGPATLFTYRDNIIKASNIIDTTYATGIIKTYIIPEPRVSIKINTGENSSFKIGYAKTSQFINQIFNTDTPAPSSQWQLSNNIIEPTRADNYSVGFFQNLDKNNWELSLEAYYRNILNVYDYKDFAQLFANPHIETELLPGIGRTQGVEISAKKNVGKFNGIMSYTFSNSSYKIAGINQGEWYRTNFDKPHNLTFILNFQPIERRTFTFNFTYGTGRPSTAPVSNYLTKDNIYVPVYSDRNQIRIPDYHRLDVSYNFARSHNKAAKVLTSWTFTIYNVYGRKNPFSVYYTRGFNNTPQANRLAVVGTVFPSISFNIEFL